MSNIYKYLRLKDPKFINVIEILCIFIFVVSLTSILMLSFNKYNSVYSLSISSIIFVAIIKFFNIKIIKYKKKFGIGFLIIILVAILFRLNPYLYVLGGQDEGIYVNMSSYYQNHGSTFIEDNVRNSLTDEAKLSYDNKNQLSNNMINAGEYEGSHVPGIYIKELNSSKYVFQFYPLHPIWMSIFAQLFGQDNRVYSLVFFSILNIIMLSLLTWELSNKSKIATYLTGTFMAINPMHIFFSKFPVTENVSIFFTATGIYFLVRYFKRCDRLNKDMFYLLMSAGSFICMFFNHISGFMYMPLFFILLLINVVFINNRDVKNNVYKYIVLVILGFSLSVLYGTKFSFPYFRDIYYGAFGTKICSSWKIILPLALLIGAVCIYGMYLFKKLAKNIFMKINFEKIATYVVSAIIGIIVLFSMIDGYQLAYTNKYIGDSWADIQYHMVKLGSDSLMQSSIIVLLLYLSPVVFVIFILAIIKNNKFRDIYITGILLFISLFMFLRISLTNFTPYYYYGRYLSGELLPYIILIACIYMSKVLVEKNKVKKIFVILSICFVTVYSLVFASFQFQGPVSENSNESLKIIKQEINKNDLLLIDKNSIGIALKTSLEYYYNINTMFVDQENIDNMVKNNITKYGNLYLLSNIPYKYSDSNYKNVLIEDSTYGSGLIHNIPSTVIPMRYKRSNFNIGLQKINMSKFMPKYEAVINFGVNGNSDTYKKIGWSGNENGMTWTDGHTASLHIPVNEPNVNLELNALVQSFGKQSVDVYINSKKIATWILNGNSYQEEKIAIDKTLINDSYLDIDFKLPNAISPSSVLENSKDNRLLGASFKSILIIRK